MRTIVFLLFSLFIIQLTAQEEHWGHIKQDVAFLAKDSLKGREMGSEGERIAAIYIAERMISIGLEGYGSEKGKEGEEAFMQYFSVTPRANPHASEPDEEAEPIHGMNVIGWKDNGGQSTIVIGAHFDHLGEGGEGSLYAGKEDMIHNGADDNASGVALLLKLAETVVDNKQLNNNNYLFIAFSGEEKGLWGSNYFCKNPTIDLATVSYMINFDMVGRLDTSRGLAINGVGTSPVWKESVKMANKNELKLILGESGVGPSDHTSFYLQNLPVLHFFTGQHEDYHKPSDDADKVNIEGIAQIHGLVQNLIAELNASTKLTFTKTKEEESNTPRFTVTLGVMPDYLYQGEGMRFDGVTEGKPADAAGFKKGDIVIQMGETKVDGMQSYMEALSKFKKGDKTQVKVKRGEEELTKEVTF